MNRRKRKAVRQRRNRLMLAAAALVLMTAFCLPALSGCADKKLEPLEGRPYGIQTAYEIEEGYEEKAPVGDMTIYGESLVLYKDAWNPQQADAYYGRNIMLKNIETGKESVYTFSGGADTGIDLAGLDPGEYEVYVYDQYAPKRARMNQVWKSVPYYTMLRNGKVRSVKLEAASDYLAGLGIEQDDNYLYLSVKEEDPKEGQADVVIDPSGWVPTGYEEIKDPGYTGDWVEAAVSWQLGSRVAQILEQAGMRVIFSRGEDEEVSYAGDNSRVARGYTAGAKIFLNLAMDDEEISLPYLISSPYTNGSLANAMAVSLNAQGVELAQISSLSHLNAGTGMDSLLLNPDYASYSPYEWTPSLRESGGRITGAGGLEGWQSNAAWQQAWGMHGVIFYYASSEDAQSRAYYMEHQEAIAQGLAKGILDWCAIPVPEQDNTQENQ